MIASSRSFVIALRSLVMVDPPCRQYTDEGRWTVLLSWAQRSIAEGAQLTKLLDEAFTLARLLPEERQDDLAARIIAELTEDDEFDRKIAATVDQLDWLIEEAKADFRAGRTEGLDYDRLLAQ